MRSIGDQGPRHTLIPSRDTSLKRVSWWFFLHLILIPLLVLQALEYLNFLLYLCFKVGSLLCGLKLVGLHLVQIVKLLTLKKDTLSDSFPTDLNDV